MMHGPEKSDLAMVAGKPANKAEQSAAESVERRAGTKGNANQQSTCRTQSRISVSQALERMWQAFAVTHPRCEPYAGKAARTVLCGGRAMKRTSLPLQRREFHHASRRRAKRLLAYFAARRISLGATSRTAASVAIFAPAPGRFSTTNAWLRRSESH
jgi:hypothetical protein